MAPDDLLLISEVSEMTRISEATLRWYRHQGFGGPKSFKLGRRIVYRRDDVLSWIKEQYDAAPSSEVV